MKIPKNLKQGTPIKIVWHDAYGNNRNERNKNGQFVKGHKGYRTGWKGNSASYTAKHITLRKNFGSPLFCINCGKKGKRKNGRWTIQWALKKGKLYSRNREDYLHLCVQCHSNYDRGWLKRKKTLGCTSKYKGVSWDKRLKKWCAYIKTDKKRIYLGLFTTEKLAHEVRLIAERKYWFLEGSAESVDTEY